MPLTPPANYTSVYVAAAVGLSIALIVGLVTRSTLPHVGDLQHSLPHGGLYKDGTKSINYFKPRSLNSIEAKASFWGQPWCLVILLVAVIICLSRKANVCSTCGRQH
ncbi:triple gene block 2 protein [Mirabilis jalapa mottle virus]|uniref:Movement protein TGB2 n=1 Tax=Mirabilis jalapa mottle virus TaxID=1093773 RepID=G5CCW7_9VIRU|nr:triple gene block 2 protein [Mirabilis jalapa mottle virus]AEQ35302.1 triple gene block 2 protein [Mirabilis jalapa mottle virus]